MIVDMTKYTFVVYHADYEEFLSEVKRIGVLHVKESDAEPTEAMQSIARQIAEVRATKQQLGQAPDHFECNNTLTTDGAELMEQIRTTRIELERTQQQIAAIEKDMQRYEPWGGAALATDALLRLRQNGVEVNLYQCQQSLFRTEWEEEGVVEVISTSNGVCYFAAFGCKTLPQPNIEADEVLLPEKSYAELAAEFAAAESKLEGLKTLQGAFALYAAPVLESYIGLLTEQMQEQVARQSTSCAASGAVRVLEGYAPADTKASLDNMLAERHIVHLAEAATAADCPPIKLRNSRFSRLFEPITEMFSLPNYSELDPTPLFAPFFMLFFGLCLGDAGYGFLVLLAAVLARRKMSPAMRGYCNLGIVLGGATIIVSLITGMVFGVDLSTLDVIPEGLRSLFVTDANFKIAGYSVMMVVAVIIGLVQILFGMCVNAAKLTKQQGHKYAISTLAWVAVLPLLAITFGLPAAGIVLSEAVTYTLYGLIALCAIGIFFFNTPGKGIVSNVGSGVWATYNMATGLLGDTLSYIRLFALGLTGGILGGVFNTMAFQAGEGLPWYAKFIVVLLILVVGHAINFGLCIIGALVHPMRLTFVEFYKNAGFEGGGKEYKPFKKH